MSAKAVKREYDLTRGPILNRLLLVAVPIMGTQLLTMLYNLTDMFWLGRLSSAAVAASGTAGMYLWLVQAFQMIGRMGAEIGVAQSLGRRDPESAQTYSRTAVLLAAVIGVICGALLFLLRGPLIGFFRIQETRMAADAELYLAICSAGIPGFFLTGALGGSFTGAGNSRTPFVVNAICLSLNIILDPLLIFWADWGIAGAAAATAAAQTLGAALLFVALKRSKGRPFPHYRVRIRPQKPVVSQIFRWSTPIAVESLLFTCMSMVITRFVNSFGTDAVAVQRVGNQIESLTWLVGGGFASAVTAFVGQNFGAGRWTRIRRGVRISSLSMLVYGGVATLVLFFLGGPLFALFLPEPELVSMGAQCTRILALCQVISCLEYNSAGAFRGLGKTMPCSIVTTVSNAVRIPIVFLLGSRMGMTGVWWGLVIGACIRGVWMVCWFFAMLRRLPVDDLPQPPPAYPSDTLSTQTDHKGESS